MPGKIKGLATEAAYLKSLEVLRENSTGVGFSASVERKENYYSVWSRDHSICSIAACLSGDSGLLETAKKGILFLLRHQGDHGQVPSYIEIENRRRVYGGLGSITSVDSNMWIVIAAAMLYKRTRDKRFISVNNMTRYKRLYRLFKAFDSDRCDLLEIHKAGDWADVFERSYHVLYDEVLYYEALKALAFLFSEGLERQRDEWMRRSIMKRIRWIRRRRPRVKRRINDVLWFTQENIGRIKEDYYIFDNIEPRTYGYYQSHVEPFKHHWEKRFETFGNVLAVSTGVADKGRARSIIARGLEFGVNSPVPVRVLDPPVRKRDRDWIPLYGRRERPYTYHNGGAWPMVGGFWIHALSRNKFRRKAKKDLAALAAFLMGRGKNFREYAHGRTGKPMGKRKQAWTAAGYVIGYHSAKGRVNLFDF